VGGFYCLRHASGCRLGHHGKLAGIDEFRPIFQFSDRGFRLFLTFINRAMASRRREREKRVRIANLFPAVVFLFAGNSVFAQQQTHAASRDSLLSDTAAFGEGQQPGTQAATKST
jgi:hypothetical protein